MSASLDYRCGHGLLKSQPCRFCAAMTNAASARAMFDAYVLALETLAGNFTTVPERKAAIQIRQEFEHDIPRYFRAVLAELDKATQPRAQKMCGECFQRPALGHCVQWEGSCQECLDKANERKWGTNG